MAATSVASSSQMISAFGQPSQSSAPANPFASNSGGQNNPFGLGGAGNASQKRTKRNSPFSDQGNTEGKRKPNNPFEVKDANSGDDRKQRGRTDDKKKKPLDVKKGRVNGGVAKKPALQNARTNGAKAANTRSQSPSIAGDDDDVPISESHHSDDPHARKVYEQLRTDGIHPPAWPSAPGNPKSKAEVTRFREKYEAYRGKVRASLTKAGLIDDPTKRKTLRDAIDFKGICEDMCPEYEKITRINESDVNQPEKSPKSNLPITRRMIKKLARSAAGQEAPLPMDVRSVPALRRTLDYLIDDLLEHDGNLPVVHGFLWDRTRAIRRDFTFFSSLTPEEMKTQVYVLENIARFHVTALHLLSQEGKAPEDFVEQQELEQLGKALLSLRDLYDDCNVQGITCENEAEFRAYYLVFHAMDPNIIETLQRQWKPNLWRDSDEVRTAVSLVEALQDTFHFHGPLKGAPSLAASAAYNTYFRILEDPKVSYTMACFAECHFPHLRQSILTTIKRAFSRPRESPKDVTAVVLNKYLRFDSVLEAIDFAELHELEFGECEEDPDDHDRSYLILDNRNSLPHPRLQHQFSQNLVEKKRGSRSLPDLIHETVYEDLNSKTNGHVEESLFVNDNPTTNGSSSLGGMTKSDPFASTQSTALGGSGGSNAFNTPGTTPNGSLSTSGSIWGQKPQTSPFTSAMEPAKPLVNSFASDPPKPSSTTAAPLGPAWGTTNPFTSSTPSTSAPQTNLQKENPFLQGGALGLNGSLAPKPTGFSFLSRPSTSPSEALPNQQSNAEASGALAKAASQPEPVKAPGIKFTPPTPELSTQPFPPVPKAVASPLSAVAQPSVATSLSEPTPSLDLKGKGVAAPSILGAPTPSVPSFQFSGITSQPPSSILGPSTTPTIPPIAPPKSPSPPPPPPAPPRDLMGDFTKWFVLGDEGLLEEFQAYMLDTILQKVYTTFQAEQEEKMQQEEADKAAAEADQFRAYNLSVRYFYQWRDVARELRLKRLRRSGRDKMREFHEAQRIAQLKADKEAARRAAREKAEIAQLNRPEEFKELLRHRSHERLAEMSASRRSAANRHGVPRITDRSPSVNGSVVSDGSSLSRSASSRTGTKTQALRKQLLGDEPTCFRRSLPPGSSRDYGSSETEDRPSRASERWRLKAMGIVQMPDGTAVPESLANEAKRGKNRHSGTGSMGPPARPVARRASISGLTNQDGRLLSSQRLTSTPAVDDAAAPKHKRKRATYDEDEAKDVGTEEKSHKRIMSDAQVLMSELRAMRQEIEESASWFKDQNERLQSELDSRGSTPWDESA